MQSMDIRQIKAALVEQAFLGTTQVRCPIGPIVAVRRKKGQLLVVIRGWGRWYSVESVSIERMVVTLAKKETLQTASEEDVQNRSIICDNPSITLCEGASIMSTR